MASLNRMTHLTAAAGRDGRPIRVGDVVYPDYGNGPCRLSAAEVVGIFDTGGGASLNTVAYPSGAAEDTRRASECVRA